MKGLLQGVDGGSTYNEYMVSLERNDELEEKIGRVKAQIQVLEQLVTNLTVTSAGTATPRLVQLEPPGRRKQQAT